MFSRLIRWISYPGFVALIAFWTTSPRCFFGAVYFGHEKKAKSQRRTVLSTHTTEALSLRDQAEREHGYRNGNSTVGRLAMACESMEGVFTRFQRQETKADMIHISKKFFFNFTQNFIVSVISTHTPFRSGRVGSTPQLPTTFTEIAAFVGYWSAFA